MDVTHPNEPCVEVKEVLGRGSFGKVFKATTPDSRWFHWDHPVVATKQILQPDDNALVEAVVLEQASSHPNLVKYITSCKDRLGNLLIVMEFCEGGTLATMIKVGLS